MSKEKYHLDPKARDAAVAELLDLGNRMFRGGQSMMVKAMRLQHPDPRAQYRVISTMRAYGDSAMPAADEMDRIEAILRGISVDQCLSEAEKRRRKKAERDRKHHEIFVKYQDEQWQEFCAWKNAQRAAQHEQPKIKKRSDGVIVGPWGAQS